jgi:rhodanese-related sulfurtransferase
MDGEADFSTDNANDRHCDEHRPTRPAEPAISAAQLRFAIASGKNPLIIDVRRAADYRRAERVIAGATWRDPSDIEGWAEHLPVKRLIVVYCVHGHHVSRYVVASLRHLGLDAWRLDGGISGWQAKGYPTAAKSQIPASFEAAP